MLYPLMWILTCLLPPRLLHIHQKAAVVGAAGVVEVEILSRLQSPANVTDVVKRANMYGTVPSGTCTGTHFLLVLRILLPRCITRRDITRMVLCHIAMCASAGIIITTQVTTLIRLPKVVFMVLVAMLPLLWLMLEAGRIRIIT